MKQIKDMTTAEWRKAWTEIAIAFETNFAERNETQEYKTRCGLCLAFDDSGESDSLMGDFAAKRRNSHWVPPKYRWEDKSGRRSDWTRNHDLIRATFAAMFAAMTPKEFLEICEAPK